MCQYKWWFSQIYLIGTKHFPSLLLFSVSILWRCWRIWVKVTKNPTTRLRGCPLENALLQKCTCIASFWSTVQMDPENAAPENALFWKWVSGWKNPKTQPSCSRVQSESTYFPKRWRQQPIPRPLTSDLWTPRRLITTTMVDYMLVFVPQKISSLSCNLLVL